VIPNVPKYFDRWIKKWITPSQNVADIVAFVPDGIKFFATGSGVARAR